MKRLLLFASLLAFAPITTLQAQWEPTNGIYGGKVSSLVTNGQTILAGIQGAGIYFSLDHGMSWKTTNGELLSFSYPTLGTDGTLFLEVDPTNLYTLVWSKDSLRWAERGRLKGASPLYLTSFIAVGKNWFAGTNRDIERSSDQGYTWTVIDSGVFDFYDNQVSAFAIIDTVLFAGTGFYGLYLSNDSGNHWLQTDTSLKEVFALTANAHSLFAGTNNGILESKDDGSSWNNISGNLPPSQVNRIVLLGTTIIISGTNGLYYSSNHGSTWSSPKNGIVFGNYTLILVGDTLFAGSSANGVFYSTDTGKNWTQSSKGLGSNSPSSFLNFGNELYAAVGPIFQSSDEGNHWTIGTEQSSLLTSLGSYIYSSGVSGFFRSKDAGITWDTIRLPSGNDAIDCILSNNNMLFVGTHDFGIYVSTDSGTTWIDGNNGLPLQSEITAITSASNDIVIGIYNGFGMPNGVYISSNNGESWIPHNGSNYPKSVSLLGSSDSIIFCGSSSEMYRSSTDDSNWSDLGTINKNNNITNVLNAFFKIDSAIFIGTDNGIFISYDNGDNFFEQDSGITYPTGIAFVECDSLLFVSTPPNDSDVSVWRRPLSQMTSSPYALGIQQTGDDSISFGTVPIGQIGLHVFTAENSGKQSLDIRSIQLSTSTNNFSTSEIPGSVGLDTGNTFTFETFFQPSRLGYQSTVMTIMSQAKTIHILLSGEGVLASSVDEASQSIPTLKIFPNPIKGTGTISFSSSEPSRAEISIVNPLGTTIAQLFSGDIGMETKNIVWNADEVPSGIYECVLRMNGTIQTIPVVVQH